MKRSLCLLAVVGLVACRTLSKPDGAEPVASADPAVSASARTAPQAAPRPALSVVYQGVCAVSVGGHVGADPALVWLRDAEWTGSAYTLGDGLPKLAFTLFRGQGTIVGVGGIDAAHLWLQTDIATRGEESYSDIRLASGAHEGFGPTADKTLVEQPDGTLWIGGAVVGDKKFQAFDTKTSAEKTTNLPGVDMLGAHRLANGELLVAARSKKNEVVLRRWSPTRRVLDLVAADSGGPLSLELRLGTQRAVIGVPGDKAHFYTYDGKDTLRESKLVMPPPTSWTVTDGDDLIATDASGELWTEHADGTVEHGKGPELGTLAPTARLPWLLGRSGALYTISNEAWVEVMLPAGPWASPQAGPRHVEWVQERGDETLVLTKHLEPSSSSPQSFDTLYSTRKRAQPFRCGAPFDPFGYAPPRADATCKTPIVLVGREASAKLPASYPKLAKALKGQTDIGPSVDVVAFGDAARPLIGIRASSFETSKSVQSALSSAKIPAELVCGAPDEKRALHFDVPAGTFAK